MELNHSSSPLLFTVHHTLSVEVCWPFVEGVGSLCHRIHPLTESDKEIKQAKQSISHNFVLGILISRGQHYGNEYN